MLGARSNIGLTTAYTISASTLNLHALLSAVEPQKSDTLWNTYTFYNTEVVGLRGFMQSL